MTSALKSGRFSNAFMLYVKEQTKKLKRTYPEENKIMISAFIREKWLTMGMEERQVYYDKYELLRKVERDKSAGMATPLKVENDTRSSISSALIEGDAPNANLKRKPTEGFQNEPSGSKKLKTEEVIAPAEKNILQNLKTEEQSASCSKNNEDFHRETRPNKRCGRPPNPFMIFAKEQRRIVSSSYLKDKKCHASTILGNMWKILPADEKKTYIEKAKRLHTLQKNSVSDKKFKNKKPVGRPSKHRKAKKQPSAKGPSNKKVLQGAVSKIDPVNSLASGPTTAVSTDIPVTAYQTSTTDSHLNLSTYPSTDRYQTRISSSPSTSYQVPRDRNNTNHGPQCSAESIMTKPYTGNGTGMVPPFFMPYAFPPFWMQQLMSYQMYLQSFSHTCPWGFPYDYCHNSYFSSYSSGRNTGYFNYPANSSAVGEAGNRAESVAAPNVDENPEHELLIVDEDSHENSQNGPA